MSTQKPARPRRPKRGPRPNNPFGVANDEWDRLCIEASQHERKWVVWSPGHDKIVAVGEDIRLVEAEVERQGYDVHEVSFQYIEPGPRLIEADYDPMAFSRRLGSLMELLGISRSDLAGRLVGTGVDEITLSDLALGRRRPYVDEVDAMADALDCPTDLLVNPRLALPSTPDAVRRMAEAHRLVNQLGPEIAWSRLISSRGEAEAG